MLLTATTNAELDEILQNNEKVVLDFYAEWCGPCKLMLPVFSRLADNDEIVGVKINVEEASELSVRFGIRSIPVLAYIKNGEVIEKTVGAKDEETIRTTFSAL